MEFLVTMTTDVPPGTLDEVVNDVRALEAARSRELAADGSLQRLWRPPLQPGEWRTLGLFAAADGDQLENVLASMPLRIWRTDQVTPLSRHPNDPKPTEPASDRGSDTEFMITMAISVPEGTNADVVDATMAKEAQRARELAAQGRLIRLWALVQGPGRPQTLGLWRAHDTAEMTLVLESLPLHAWMSTDTVPLAAHPNDPGGLG